MKWRKSAAIVSVYIIALALGVVGALALKSMIPEAPAATVTLDTSQGPVVIEINVVDPEPPGPPPAESPFPGGIGCWNYPGDDNAEALLAHRFTWYQAWSRKIVSWKRPEAVQAVPYMVELQPEWWDKAERKWKVKRAFDRLDGPEADTLKRILAYYEGDPLCLGVNLSCETGHGPHTALLREYIRAHHPNLKIFTGPFWYELDFEGFDGLMGFMNFTRLDRLPEDLYWCEAVAAMHGVPWCVSVQPVNGVDEAGRIVLANPEWFAEALELAGRLADGLNIWSVDRLLGVEAGEIETAAPERLRALWDALAAARVEPAPERPEVRVYLAGNWEEDRFLCRVVGRAGLRPVGTLNEGEARVRFADFLMTAEEDANWRRFKECKWPEARTGQIETENRLAAELAARLR